MGAEVLVPLLIAGASTGAQLYNTRRTEAKQDRALADSIRNQGRKQAQADARVNEELAKLESSRSDDERRQREGQYLDTLRSRRGVQQSGLSSVVGSSTFQQDLGDARADNAAFAADTAGLEARIDAPSMQRQGEGFGFGRLATDLSLLERESRGDAYLDELRMRSIRRNPFLDAASQIGMAYAGAKMGSQGIAPGEPSPYGPYRTGYRYPGTATPYGVRLPNYGS